MNRKTVLVTGGTGFIGVHLVNKLIIEKWDVHLIVRPSSDLSPLHNLINQVKVHLHNGACDCMIEIVKAVQPRIVIHLASLFLAEHTSQDINRLIESNVTFGTQLIEAMVRNNVKCLINTGTSWQNYENQNYNPVCLYAATKQAFEDIFQFYIEAFSLRVITLKLFDTYGPNDSRNKLFNLLKKIASSLQPLEMSPGEQLIDIVYIDDVVNAYLVAMDYVLTHPLIRHETYAVSSGHPIQLKKLVDMYSLVSGNVLPIKWGGRPYRSREVMTPWSLGTPLPNWKPAVTIEDGLRKILQNE